MYLSLGATCQAVFTPGSVNRRSATAGRMRSDRVQGLKKPIDIGLGLRGELVAASEQDDG
jgi:hypothetical protein